jgi:hypothetical protein
MDNTVTKDTAMSTSPLQEIPVHCNVQMSTAQQTVICNCLIHLVGTQVYLPVKLYYPDEVPLDAVTMTAIRREAVSLCNLSLLPQHSSILLVDISPPVESE